jgi:uroporphyrinogen-III synthase
MNLSDKRVLITRPRGQTEEFARALAAASAQPVFFPVIEIIPPEDPFALDFAMRDLEQYDWLILTSVHGAEAFFERLDALGMKRLPPRMRVAAVGSRTARCLSQKGVWVDYVPGEYSAEAMLAGFGRNLYGKRFLFPCSNLTRAAFADGIRSAGGLVTEVVAYRNVLREPDGSELEELRAGVDIITFTSPSAVRNFVEIVRRNGLDPLNLPNDPLFACIGPVTEHAARDAGLTRLVAAKEYTPAGLVEAVTSLERQ